MAHRQESWVPKDQNSEEMEISLDSQAVQVCDKCDYEAEDLYDFDAHTWVMHMSYEEDKDNLVVCNLCERRYADKHDLMYHSKEAHPERVNICWHFLAGNCPFGEEKCWFIHNSSLFMPQEEDT